MSPVEFNPNVKTPDVKDKNNNTSGSSEKSSSSGQTLTQNSPTSADKYTRSAVMSTLQQVSLEPSAQDNKQRADKIAQLKQQVADGALPIQSEDSDVRLQAALTVSEKLIDLEAQLPVAGE